jgi:hypothetical protein
MTTDKEYLQPDTSGYGSHIKPLQFIFSVIEVAKAVELGMGYFSTGFLLDHVKESLTSLEMQEERWFRKIVERFSGHPKWVPIIALNPGAYRVIELKGVDFALSDGHGDSRPQAVNHFMLNEIPTIVGHDTESTWYNWHLVEAERFGYFTYQFTDIAPYTTVWTKDKGLIEALQARP